MIAVLQRVSKASVTIGGVVKSKILNGLLVFVGIEEADGTDDVDWLASKIVNLRIFNDGQGVMNLSVKEIGGELLIVSQFTLHASTKKGNRPSYMKAAGHHIAVPLYESFIQAVQQGIGKRVQTGEFGADMKVQLLNDGPVTIVIDTKNKL
ncbi:MAG: D-aminoacyl-tRNA deacylase [Chryseolinea sp.]